MATLGSIASNTELATFANINPTGLTSGDALVTADGVTFVPGKVVTKTWGVGEHLSVTGNASVGGNLAVTGAAAITGALSCVTGATFNSANKLISIIPAPAAPASFAGMWIGQNTPDFQNYALLGGDGNAYFNAPAGGLLNFRINNVDVVVVNDSTMTFGNLVFGFPFAGYAGFSANGALTAERYNLLSGPTDRDLYINRPAGYNIRFRENNVDEQMRILSGGIIETLCGGASTNSVSTGIRVAHNIAGTPAAGFGTEVRWRLKSSTTEDQDAAGITAEWTTATHASRAALCKAYAYYTSTARECFRWEADSSDAKIGFLGVAAAAQQTGGAATAGAAYTATEQTMLQTAYDALRTFGFLD